MKKETRFSEAPDDDRGKSKSKLENAGNKKAKRKMSLMRDQETEWIKQNICTKVKVKAEDDNDEDIINEVETKAFGVIDFIGAARTAKAKFVQMSDDTRADIIFELLTTLWKLTEPQILISITGGAKLFKMEEHMKEFLVEGLRKITQSSGTWVITGGTNTGIMKLVGESLQGYELTDEQRLQYTVPWNRVEAAENLFLDTNIKWEDDFRAQYDEDRYSQHPFRDFTARYDEDLYSQYPYRDIFLWAVVNNMQDMAKVLWKLGDEQIAKAIVAAQINRKLAEKAEDKNLSDEIIQMFKNNQIEFKELALKVLDSCYNESTSKTKILLTSELVQFPSQNCISLANESYFQEFVAHKAVQQVLKELWRGELVYENQLIKVKDARKEDTTESNKEVNDVNSKNNDPNIQLIDGKRRSQNYRTCMSQDEQRKYNGSDNQNKSSTRKILSYSFDAPVRKYIRSLVSYCIFLLLISYCAVLKKDDATLNVIEIIVLVWVVSFTMEQSYQISVTPGPTFLQQVTSPLKDNFRRRFVYYCDSIAVTLYFVAFGLKLSSSLMEYGHLLYAIDAMLWIVRLLQYFYASKILGPYVFMIGRMFIDMCYFISILVVFTLAYGVLSSAILRPEKQIYNMIKNIVYFPYFNIYGELFADNDSSPGMTKFGTKEINDYAEPISWFFLGIFLLIANVLLLNLLIAIFGNTFSEVQEKADQIWRFRRHDLVTEYALKLSLPPPFTVFILIKKWISSTRKLFSSKMFWHQTETDEDILREEIGEFQMKHVISVLWLQKTELQKNDMNERWEEMHDVLKTVETRIANLQERK